MTVTLAAPLPAPGDRTKSRVLGLLKSRRCSTAQSVADALDISVPAARKHLADLEEAGLISSETQKPGGRGRPQFVYNLTALGEAQFPKSYGSLCVDILRHVENLFGQGAVLRVVDARRLELAEQWGAELRSADARGDDLRARAERLTELLNTAGYAARLVDHEGALYLEQGNCPSLDVARSFSALCDSEIALYRDLLGADVTRETRIACGAPACRYRLG